MGLNARVIKLGRLFMVAWLAFYLYPIAVILSFVDPTTGQLMKVRYNPQTGARDYVPITPHPDPPAQGGREKGQ